MKKKSSRRGSVRGGNVPPFVSFEEDSDTARAEGFRHARLSDVLRQELGSLLRDDVADPALDGVSVAFVELSPDYRSAKVHVTTARVCAPAPIERALERAAPFLRRCLTDAVDLKFVPALRFSVATGVVSTTADGGEPCE
jgi:ribosome-binding factor A